MASFTFLLLNVSIELIENSRCKHIMREVMAVLETTKISLLVETEDGTIRIANSRVSLDSIVYHFKLGASAEQIVQKFPSLDLADVYGAISYYLNNKPKVEEYLQKQEIEADLLQQEIESNPQYQANVAELRNRIFERVLILWCYTSNSFKNAPF